MEVQRVAVVTGGANGIGRCIAEEFRKQNVKVYVIDKAEGDHYVGDISDKSVLEAFADTVIRENGDPCPRRQSGMATTKATAIITVNLFIQPSIIAIDKASKS